MNARVAWWDSVYAWLGTCRYAKSEWMCFAALLSVAIVVCGPLQAESAVDLGSISSSFDDDGPGSEEFREAVALLSGWDRESSAEEQVDGLRKAIVSLRLGNGNARALVSMCLRRGIAEDISNETRFRAECEEQHAEGRLKPVDIDLLGLMTLYGRGGAEASVTDAIRLFEQAARKDHEESALSLAAIYTFEQGVPVDAEKASYWLSQADAEHPRRKVIEALQLISSEPDNSDLITGLLESAINAGSTHAYVAGAWYLQHHADAPKTLNGIDDVGLAELAAKNGDADALYFVADTYERDFMAKWGKYVHTSHYRDIDTSKRRSHWRRAAHMGGQLGDADYKYAQVLWLENTAAMRRSSLRWFDIASSRGNHHADYWRGVAIEKGIAGQTSNKPAFERAKPLYVRAADAGYVPAMMRLAHHYANTNVIDISSEQNARHYYKRAAEAGSTRAMLHIGKRYVNGPGRRYVDEGLAWLRKASDSGETEAIYMIAMMKAGLDPMAEVDLDVGEARRLVASLIERDSAWGFLGKARLQIENDNMVHAGVRDLQTAADRGNAQAMYLLGTHYGAGDGVPKDYDKAIQYITLAEQSGYSTNTTREIKAALIDIRNHEHQGRAVATGAIVIGSLLLGEALFGGGNNGGGGTPVREDCFTCFNSGVVDDPNSYYDQPCMMCGRNGI